MFTYFAYGIEIHSDVYLPELPEAVPHSCDATIRLGQLERPSPEEADEYLSTRLNLEEAFYFWPEVGAFLIRGGCEIVVDPQPGVEEALVRLPLVGTVIATLLHQRGLLVLHASAVSVDGIAVAFIGAKGQGKSTSTASLYKRGHELITDDIVAIQIDATGTPMVLPGAIQIKLWSDSVQAALGEDPETLEPLASVLTKRARIVTERCAAAPTPLRRIYVLQRGPELDIVPLAPQAALAELIVHTYVARFGSQLLRGNAGRDHLLQCTQVLRVVSVAYLRRPAALELLPIIAAQIEQDVKRDLVMNEVA